MEMTYKNAINLLNSRRRNVRPSKDPNKNLGLELMPASNAAPLFKGTPSIIGMQDWLQQLGYSTVDVNKLNIIHVSGTKGKGSTCAFVSSFLEAHGERTGFPRKVGLYTSPHLKYVQERVQINSKPLPEKLFAKYVFEVWDRLSSYDSAKPRYLQLLMLVSVHAFIKENVDAAIYETHHGGEYDATNIIQQSVVSGITPIGIDHVKQLGPTIGNIAWHKAGIFKTGSPAFSTLQDSEATAMLESRAEEKEVDLQFVMDVDTALPVDATALKPEVQRRNASLALALTNAFLKLRGPEAPSRLNTHDIANGVEHFFWLGRFQQIVQGHCQWFLDGAHNELSVSKATEWFADVVMEDHSDGRHSPLILIFGHISERDGAAILKRIALDFRERGISIQHLILTTYAERQDGLIPLDRCFSYPITDFPSELQKTYINAWESINLEGKTAFEPTIEEALHLARSIGEKHEGIKTLITGSLYLVGGALRLLQPRPSGLHA